MVMKTRYYADGGKVASDKPPPRPKPPPPPPPKPEGERRSLMDAVGGKIRREREAALGLKDGGKVKKRRRYADGGVVKKLPGPETRKLPAPAAMPKPKSGPKPKRIGR